jgi:hypothetical protein
MVRIGCDCVHQSGPFCFTRGLDEIQDPQGGFGLITGLPDLRLDREELDPP